MRTRYPVEISTLALLLPILCAGQSGADPQQHDEEAHLGKVSQPLVGGTVVDVDTREAYGLLTLNDRCSASLLRNVWAITAAHCVDRPGTVDGEFVTKPEDSITLRGDWRTVQERQSMRIITFRPLDLAIVRVSKPFVVNHSDTNYNREIYRDPMDNLPLTVFGRGIMQFAHDDVPVQSDDEYRVGHFSVGKHTTKDYVIASSQDTWLAGGDSGGPSFTAGPDGDQLVGVHSTAGVTCVEGHACGFWPGPGPAPAGYRMHEWVASTYDQTDALASAAWNDVDRYLGAYVPVFVKLSPRVKLDNPGPPLSICDSAREARARHSPAAPTLEQQCLAVGETSAPAPPPSADINALAARGAQLVAQDPQAAELRGQQRDADAQRGFDIGMGAADGQTMPGPGKQRLHDALPAAQRDGYAAAVAYSLSHNTHVIADYAPRGQQLANADPLALELRDSQPTATARMGFDIGMGVAEGQTAPGPGKQRIHDALPLDQQEGFDWAVAFTLERNRNADLAAAGAAVVVADPQLRERREQIPSPMLKLGFNIAVGLFAAPALGGQGLPTNASGAISVCDGLGPAARRGFAAAAAAYDEEGR